MRLYRALFVRENIVQYCFSYQVHSSGLVPRCSTSDVYGTPVSAAVNDTY